jgi:hypothetical protein
VVIKDEGVVQEGFKQGLITTREVEDSLWGHDVTRTIWEREGVVD